MEIVNSILENQIEEAVRRLPYGLDPIMVGGKPYATADNRLGAKCHRGHPHLYHLADILAREVACVTCTVDNSQFHRNLNALEEIFEQPFTLCAPLTVQHPKIPVIVAVGPADDAIVEKNKIKITIKFRNHRSTKKYITTVLQTYPEMFDEAARNRIMV